MATPSVLTFDVEGRAVDFQVLVDDLQLFLQCDRADGLSMFDLTSGASPAPAADADASVRSQWATRDAAARLAVRRHLPTTERAHFSQYKSAQTLDHFLSVCPTTLTVDLLEKALRAIEKSIVAVGASCGDPCTPVFEGCSPSPILPSVASTAVADLVGFESVGAASARAGDAAQARARGARALKGLEGTVEVVVKAVEGVGVVVGVVPGVAAVAAAVEAAEAVEVAEGAKAAEVVEEVEVEEAAEAAVVERVATL
ncbi:unnamed protein product [Closterium sp. NIES-65]|nr:unnamed protein product [Closterium sp. NIES-65]